MISFEQALGIHPQALAFRSSRAQILAGNLANVDTPKFLARDIRFDDVLEGELTGKVNTDNLHMPMGPDGTESSLLYRLPFQKSSDGNTVELHVEQGEFTQNSIQFQASLTFLNKKLKGLELAINGRV
ncbi:flagellar basal body rod protein FlgB [Endozoicomonas arenosclerae]|uniref:flagellar basal body rod protein FlgB n=1 Tax=Endozoicomonas arenosclerae TaxID=1633495 RepID=UPI00078433D6|nr:flagellar basal body rod protein FlgB [Endozoicomonas arenosclerae]